MYKVGLGGKMKVRMQAAKQFFELKITLKFKVNSPTILKKYLQMLGSLTFAY